MFIRCGGLVFTYGGWAAFLDLPPLSLPSWEWEWEHPGGLYCPSPDMSRATIWQLFVCTCLRRCKRFVGGGFKGYFYDETLKVLKKALGSSKISKKSQRKTEDSWRVLRFVRETSCTHIHPLGPLPNWVRRTKDFREILQGIVISAFHSTLQSFGSRMHGIGSGTSEPSPIGQTTNWWEAVRGDVCIYAYFLPLTWNRWTRQQEIILRTEHMFMFFICLWTRLRRKPLPSQPFQGDSVNKAETGVSVDFFMAAPTCTDMDLTIIGIMKKKRNKTCRSYLSTYGRMQLSSMIGWQLYLCTIKA